MKVLVKTLTKKQRIETLDALYTAASSARGRKAVKLFLRDLLTESERIMLGRRIIIARKLIAGVGRDDIASELRVGYDTIHRVHRWLHDEFPGYEQVVREMEKEFEKRRGKWNKKTLYATSVMYRLKKKYPLHFLLFPGPKH
jgi:uncharacterized protein YerC